MKFIKKNKKLFLGIVLGMIASSGVVYASGLLAASITYDNTTSGLKDSNDNNVTDVQTAIDVLYNKAQAASQSGSGSSSSGNDSFLSLLLRRPVAWSYPDGTDDELCPTWGEEGDNCPVTVYVVNLGDSDTYEYDGVGVNVGNEKYYFRANNPIGEIMYFKSVIPDAVCQLDTYHSDDLSRKIFVCSSASKGFSCGFNQQGAVACSDGSYFAKLSYNRAESYAYACDSEYSYYYNCDDLGDAVY